MIKKYDNVKENTEKDIIIKILNKNQNNDLIFDQDEILFFGIVEKSGTEDLPNKGTLTTLERFKMLYSMV